MIRDINHGQLDRCFFGNNVSRSYRNIYEYIFVVHIFQLKKTEMKNDNIELDKLQLELQYTLTQARSPGSTTELAGRGTHPGSRPDCLHMMIEH